MRTRIISTLAACMLAAPAWSAITPPAGLNPGLRASTLEEPAFMLTGTGDSIFECRPLLTEANAFQWVFVAPAATLYEGTRSVGRLATANTWESSSDRSSVSGLVRASQAGGVDNLPWTLMRAHPAGDSGLFAGVTSIQRVNTTGGIAPATGCDASRAGAEARVAFSAEYYFYRRR
jgi:uncharacterized protein DUF3455